MSREIGCRATRIHFRGFGFYPRSGFIHIDSGPAREWGERFARRATPFAVETPRAREVLAESRTMKDGVVVGATSPIV
jgi:hypothetical protein